jgi:RND family efflux transporter MFP subunit
MRNLILLLTTLILITSCKKEAKKETNLSKLISEKSVLMKQIDSLNQKVKDIELAINQLDTTQKNQKVTTLIAKDTVLNHYINLQGTVASDQNVTLNPEMGGTITAVLVKEGQRVSAGQTLVKLDDQSLHDRVNEVQTQLNLATTTFERQAYLWNQKIGSEMQYLQAKAQKEGLEKTLKSIYTQINKMRITAPFSGIVDEIFFKKGELTGPQSPVLRLINLSKMYVEVEVPETYLKSIKKGTPVILDFASIGKKINAKINEVSNYINPDNRSFKVRINLNNPDGALKPNLLANIAINDFSGKGIVLPKQIIQMNQAGEKFVYAVHKEGNSIKTNKRVLELGIEYNNEILILNGLKTGDTLVNEGGKFLKDGDQIEF